MSRLAQERQQRLEQLARLHKLIIAVSHVRTPEAIFDAALEGIQAILHLSRAAILTFDEEGVMRFRVWRGLSDRYRRTVEGHSPWAADEADPRPILVTDVTAEPSLEALCPVVLAEGIRALAFIPLISQGKLLGKFMLYHDRPHTFRAEEIQLAETIAAYVAFAVERQQAEAALEETVERRTASVTIAIQGLEKEIAERRQAEARLRALGRQLVVAQEAERRRLSHELHDSAAQLLTALQLQLKLLRQDVAEDAIAIQAQVADIEELAKEAYEEIRAVAHALRPPVLAASALDAALEALCGDFARRSGLHIHYDGAETAALGEELSLGLYRFLQEALANVAKHARASTVQVTFHCCDGRLALHVQDDGVGFDLPVVMPFSSGTGLLGLKERLEALGGSLAIESQPGRGTLVRGSCPIEEG